MVYLIEICGIDGSGKTTLMNHFRDMFLGNDNVILTSEPYNRELVRSYQAETPIEAAYLFAMDRYRHLEALKLYFDTPEIELIITDRYYHCSFAYQAYDGVPIHFNEQIQPLNLVIPALSILLTCDHVIAADRSGEDAERLRIIQNIYRSVFQYPIPNPMVEVQTACRKPETIAKDVMQIITDFQKVMKDERL